MMTDHKKVTFKLGGNKTETLKGRWCLTCKEELKIIYNEFYLLVCPEEIKILFRNQD